MTAGAAAFAAARWQALCGRLGVPPDHAARARFGDLQRAYAEPARHYHTAQHITECLALFDAVAPQLRDAPLVELAIWLHDAVYDPRAPDNEARSADLALTWFNAALERVRLARLARWIVATRGHAPAQQEPDLQALLDIDLAILAAPPQRFSEYESQVAREYGFVPGFVFRARRRQFLQQLVARPWLYGVPALEHLEPAARANLLGRLADKS